MIKTCFIISGFAYSGAEVVLNRYLNENKIIDASFIVLYKKPDVVNTLSEIYGKDKVHCLNISHNKNILRFIPWIDINKICKKIGTIIEVINPDLIYCNNTMEAMLVSKYISKTKIPSIAHIHDMKKSIKSSVRKYTTIKSLKAYDKIITVSEATKKQWGIEDIIVIYNGIEEKYFIDYEKNINEIKNIGFVGSISKRKGVDILIDSIEDLLNNGNCINIAYSNIEDKNLYNYILKMKEKYSNKINLYYKLDARGMISFYDSIDLLVVPSRQDPLPTVVIEAMARKTVTIGSNIGGIPEMIKDERLLIDINNNKNLFKKIKEISYMNKNELRALSYDQYNYCRNNFDNEVKVKKVNQLILDIVE